MAQNLIDYLKAHSCEGFKPVPHYFASGDYLTLFLSDVRCRTQRVDETLSIYISEENGELVGCKIKGVRLMLDEASSFGVAVDAGKLKLGFLFFIGAQMAKDEHKRKYYEVKDLFKDTPIDDVALSAAG
jgi:hypothetical protein